MNKKAPQINFWGAFFMKKNFVILNLFQNLLDYKSRYHRS